MVGRIQYQVEDRIDVIYPLKELSRELGENCTKGTVMRMKRLIRYMSGHRYTEFRYLKGEMPE